MAILTSNLQRDRPDIKPGLSAQVNLAHPLAKGLAGRWIMNEGAGNTLFDASGNGNHGTLIGGPTWTVSSRGKVLSFDGVNDRVDLGAVKPIFPFTVSVWANHESGTFYLFGQEQNGGNEGTYAGNNVLLPAWTDIHTQTGQSDGSSCTSGARRSYNTINVFSKNEWHHVAVVFNSIDGLEIYVDGVLEALGIPSGSETNFSYEPEATLSMGGLTDEGCGSSAYGKGKIDDARVYNRALSADEIRSLFVDPFQDLRPARKFWFMPEAAPSGGLSIPVAMNSYKRRYSCRF